MNRDFVLISKSWNYSIFYNPLQTLTMLSYQSFFKSILQKILQNFKNHSELWKINQSNVRFFLFVFFFFLFFFSIVLILKEYNIVKSIGQSNQLRGEKRYLTSFQPFSFSSAWSLLFLLLLRTALQRGKKNWQASSRARKKSFALVIIRKPN